MKNLLARSRSKLDKEQQREFYRRFEIIFSTLLTDIRDKFQSKVFEFFLIIPTTFILMLNDNTNLIDKLND